MNNIDITPDHNTFSKSKDEVKSIILINDKKKKEIQMVSTEPFIQKGDNLCLKDNKWNDDKKQYDETDVPQFLIVSCTSRLSLNYTEVHCKEIFHHTMKVKRIRQHQNA